MNDNRYDYSDRIKNSPIDALSIGEYQNMDVLKPFVFFTVKFYQV